MADGIAGGEVEPERLIGERIAGRFIVERLIGRGQLSTAFRAHDERLHRRVTVKVFHPRHRDDVQVMESQLAAARAVARLSHEHVAMVIDRGEHEGMPLVVLEHVRGENLQERIERFAPLAVAEVAACCLQVARALAYAHGHGVVHGNLRPANVLLTEERDVKLVDFGGGSYVVQLVGDPYAAPELAAVDPDVPAEPSDDIYSLGALAFVALTEQAPRPGLDPTELQVLRPDVSPRLAASIARALSVDPADRHLSMRELAAELASAREAVGSSQDSGAARGSAHADQPTQAWSIHDEDEQTTEPPRDDAATTLVSQPRPRRRRQEERRPRTPREMRARILAWSMVVAPLAALMIFGLMIAGERASEQVESGEGGRSNQTTRTSIVDVGSFDPPPGGDGTERDDLLASAFDGDPDTSWQSEGYSTTDFNAGSKDGVGLVIQLDGVHDVRDVQVATDLPGWVVQVMWAPSPVATLDGWTAASEPVAVRNNTRIPVELDGDRAEFLLLWITQLAIDTKDTNKARARLSELAVFVADD
jgi:eukaryotic-like serine/threonine-protein kinase